jgi:uncharacterized membrane protein YfcA
MDLLILLAVFLLGFVTMFFGAISGGVGLITRPILIFMGFPSNAVIASSKVAGFIGDLPGLYLLNRHNRVDWKIVLFLIIPMTLGTVIASIAVLTFLKGSLDFILGILLLFAGFFLLFKSKIGIIEKPKTALGIRTKIISFCLTLPVSFLNTISGGLGPIFNLLYIWIYKKTFISASALGRIASNISSIFSVIIFIIGRIVDWQLCLSLMAGFALGSFFGTKFGLKKGESFIRYIIIIVTFLGAIKLLFL